MILLRAHLILIVVAFSIVNNAALCFCQCNAGKSTSFVYQYRVSGELLHRELELRFRWCPPGVFLMGSPENEEDREKNETQVRVSLRGFWMGETEVTQKQWEAVMSTRPWEIGEKEIVWEGIENKPDVPANYVSFDDAVAFCKAFTKQQQAIGKIAKECEFVLPTEAQWEYACRAGTSTAFYFGNDRTNLSKYAWNDGSLKSVGLLEQCHNWYSV
jgi:formylglycine-generating enzyme required for sulfatase activity